jgi:hypothetical protein
VACLQIESEVERLSSLQNYKVIEIVIKKIKNRKHSCRYIDLLDEYIKCTIPAGTINLERTTIHEHAERQNEERRKIPPCGTCETCVLYKIRGVL